MQTGGERGRHRRQKRQRGDTGSSDAPQDLTGLVQHDTTPLPFLPSHDDAPQRVTRQRSPINILLYCFVLPGALRLLPRIFPSFHRHPTDSSTPPIHCILITGLQRALLALPEPLKLSSFALLGFGKSPRALTQECRASGIIVLFDFQEELLQPLSLASKQCHFPHYICTDGLRRHACFVERSDLNQNRISLPDM